MSTVAAEKFLEAAEATAARAEDDAEAYRKLLDENAELRKTVDELEAKERGEGSLEFWAEKAGFGSPPNSTSRMNGRAAIHAIVEEARGLRLGALGA